MDSDRQQAHLDQLRKSRNRPEPQWSLGFLREQFKRQVEKPYRQLGTVSGLWSQLVPQDLARHTRLESLSRGVLRVAVDSSARLYELDRMLRLGLEQKLRTHPQGKAIRRIKLLRTGDDLAADV